MEPVVRFLSDEEIKQRYPKEKLSPHAILSREAIAMGYKIALVESDDLVCHNVDGELRLNYVLNLAEDMLDLLIPEHRREFLCFTDLGETPQGRLYCAIRER